MAKKVVEEVQPVREFPQVFVIEVEGVEHELIARDETQAEAFKKQGFQEKE
jgi:hypothetical protein